MELVEKTFRETKVSEVLAEPGSVTPLCEQVKTVSLTTSRPKKKAASTKRPKKKKAKKKAKKR